MCQPLPLQEGFWSVGTCLQFHVTDTSEAWKAFLYTQSSPAHERNGPGRTPALSTSHDNQPGDGGFFSAGRMVIEEGLKLSFR